MDQEELDERHQPPPADRRRRVLVADREDAPSASIDDAREDRRWRASRRLRRRTRSSSRSDPAVCGRSSARILPGPVPVARPRGEPAVEQPRRDLGLDEVLMLRRALAHRLRRCGPPGRRHQGRVEPVAADERLRRPVRGFEQPELPLESGQGEHPVVAQGRRELLGGEAVDLVPAVGDEVEHEAELPELLGELPHLVVAQPGGVPVERRRQVVGEHLVRDTRRGSPRRIGGRPRGRPSSSPSTAGRRTARRRVTWRSRSRSRPGPGSSPRASWAAPDPRRR